MHLRSGVLLCFALVLQATVCTANSQAAQHASSGSEQPLALVQIELTPGRAIPTSFLGLSHEWRDAQWMMGDSTTGVNHIYRQLLTNLTAYGSGPVQIRIGGNSTDLVGRSTPQNIKPFAEIATQLGARFTLGVNLGLNDPALAAEQTRVYLHEMPQGSVDGIEIGNEPDLYARNGMRPKAYSLQNYYEDFDRWRKAITPYLPPATKLVGPSWASTGMLPELRKHADFPWSSLGAISQHHYAGDPARIGSDDFLLRPDAATSGPSSVASAVALAHSHGIAFRMGELNSLDDRGAHGVSDAFGATLWAIDTMFEYLRVGVDGVNWESSRGNFDNPFSFKAHTGRETTTYTLTSVSPLYYGLLFFQSATGSNSHLIETEVRTAANLKAWATVDGSGTVRLVLLNKDTAAAGNVTLTISGYSHASVQRLLAPSYTSTTGITFSGQTFDGSTDGSILGKKRLEDIAARRGTFQLSMPTVSAAIVTFRR